MSHTQKDTPQGGKQMEYEGVSATAERPESWLRQDQIIREIRENGLEAYISRSIERLHGKRELPVGCIDERSFRSHIGNAGSTALESAEERAICARLILESGVQVPHIERHKGCGAEGLATKALIKQGLSEAEALARVAQDIEDFAKLLNVPVKWSEMLDEHNHVARATIISGTPNLDVEPLHEDGLHPFLVSSRFVATPQTAIERALLSWNIAKGDHGFGEDAFSQEDPFLFLVIGDPRSEQHNSGQLSSLLEQRLTQLSQEERTKLLILSYDPPAETLTI